MRDLFPTAPHGAVVLLRPVAERLGLSTLPDHFHEIIFAFLFYNFVYILLAPVLSQQFAGRNYLRLPARSQIDWNVRVVSQVQSILILCFAFFIIFTDHQRQNTDWKERLWGYNGATGMVQAFAAGYFIWDLQVSAMHLNVLGVGSLVHALGALVVTCLGFRPFANYYGLNFILYEISTPFLNIHWFFDKLQMTGSTAQLINGIILIVTFGCSRLLWGTYQSILIYHDLWTAWMSTIPTDFATSTSVPKSAEIDATYADGHNFVLPLWLGILYLGSNTVLSVLNFYWFSKMIAAVRKRFPKEGRRPQPLVKKVQ